MACGRMYDFLAGTEVFLALPAVPMPAGGRWDILHPNARADRLVARHIEALGRMVREIAGEDPSDIAAPLQ